MTGEPSFNAGGFIPGRQPDPELMSGEVIISFSTGLAWKVARTAAGGALLIRSPEDDATAEVVRDARRKSVEGFSAEEV